MSTMEMSTSSNGPPISSDPMPDTLMLSARAISAKSTPSDVPHQNGNHTPNSANTVCYLANGTGQIDRLNLVLPLTTSSASELSMLSTSPPFSSHLMHQTALSHSDFHSDSDRTPVNTEGSFPFMPTSLTQSSSSSSCRTVDSGTESICSDSVEDYMQDMGTDRILKFFASDNSKSSRFSSRRPTSGGPRQTSTDDDEDIYSDDESTLSESSLSPQEFTSSEMMITPESVVAAIDKQIKERATKLATVDKDTSDDGASDCANNGDTLAPPIEQSRPANEADTLISISERKHLEEIAHKNRFEPDDDLDDDDDDDDCPRIPLIRSTSLKTGKTPPGTPRGKKIVRFADAMGLDLESVRHIVDDGPYMPPLAAFKGLKLDEDEKRWLFEQNQQSPALSLHQQTALSLLAPLPPLVNKPNLRVLFCQPSSDPGPFLERIRSHKVCLENCMVTGPSGPSDMFTITCIIRVLNVGFEKGVTLRFTTNEWLTFTDVMASYVPNSCDGFSDKFTVTFHVAVNSNGHHSMMPGQRLLFALKYSANGSQEYWDNNMGLNYALIYQRS